MQGARVRTLVRELRSHMPCGVAKKPKNKAINAYSQNQNGILKKKK